MCLFSLLPGYAYFISVQFRNSPRRALVTNCDRKSKLYFRRFQIVPFPFCPIHSALLQICVELYKIGYHNEIKLKLNFHATDDVQTIGAEWCNAFARALTRLLCFVAGEFSLDGKRASTYIAPHSTHTYPSTYTYS